MKVGIVGYGAYVPRHRIKVEEIAKVWGADAPSYRRGLRLREKSVPAPDQDTITMSVEAARHAIRRAGHRSGADRRDLHRLGVASLRREAERHGRGRGASAPRRRSTAPTSSSPARREPRGCSWPCRWSRPAQMDYALGIGADTSQGAPGDALEYSASAGAAAFIFGAREARRGLRAHLRLHDRHAGFLAARVPVLSAPRRPLHRASRPTSSTYCPARARPDGAIGHDADGLPVGRLPPAQRQVPACGRPRSSASRRSRSSRGWLSPTLGNTYSGSSPMGLTAILDVAKPGDRILMVSYGSGAGSDGFIWRVTDRITEVQQPRAADARPARGPADLHRLRHVRQVPRQDPQAGAE